MPLSTSGGRTLSDSCCPPPPERTLDVVAPAKPLSRAGDTHVPGGRHASAGTGRALGDAPSSASSRRVRSRPDAARPSPSSRPPLPSRRAGSRLRRKHWGSATPPLVRSCVCEARDQASQYREARGCGSRPARPPVAGTSHGHPPGNAAPFPAEGTSPTSGEASSMSKKQIVFKISPSTS